MKIKKKGGGAGGKCSIAGEILCIPSLQFSIFNAIAGVYLFHVWTFIDRLDRYLAFNVTSRVRTY